MKPFDIGDQTWCYATSKNPIEDGEYEFEVITTGFYKRVKIERGEFPFTWFGYPYFSAEDFFNYVLADIDSKIRDMFIISTINISHQQIRTLKSMNSCLTK